MKTTSGSSKIRKSSDIPPIRPDQNTLGNGFVKEWTSVVKSVMKKGNVTKKTLDLPYPIVVFKGDENGSFDLNGSIYWSYCRELDCIGDGSDVGSSIKNCVEGIGLKIKATGKIPDVIEIINTKPGFTNRFGDKFQPGDGKGALAKFRNKDKRIEAILEKLRKACGSGRQGWSTIQTFRESLNVIEILNEALYKAKGIK